MISKVTAPLLVGFLAWFMWMHQQDNSQGTFKQGWKQFDVKYPDKPKCEEAIGRQVESAAAKAKEKQGVKVETTKSGVTMVSGTTIIIGRYFCYEEGYDPRK